MAFWRQMLKGAESKKRSQWKWAICKRTEATLLQRSKIGLIKEGPACSSPQAAYEALVKNLQDHPTADIAYVIGRDELGHSHIAHYLPRPNRFATTFSAKMFSLFCEARVREWLSQDTAPPPMAMSAH